MPDVDRLDAFATHGLADIASARRSYRADPAVGAPATTGLAAGVIGVRRRRRRRRQ